ncbi:hypothetical protein Rifp1Sym_dh00030 [endosymbiont of Riftia pachyptila (vent Ph05)]|uniref:Uncharacterized protein n=1 Tax=endosymbiont of Riftia pachyptila (vent Ph05) TaxID=1048808 RepID=G2DG83_9GAMM|nr:hypothetical protein Rifp1Sym_dh00030 [endosymbiont of Riftia pachyptila (vent Ph05)]
MDVEEGGHGRLFVGVMQGVVLVLAWSVLSIH